MEKKKGKRLVTKERVHLYLEHNEIKKMDRYAKKLNMNRSVFAQLLISTALETGITIKISKITLTQRR
jgi:hypothetical protein